MGHSGGAARLIAARSGVPLPAIKYPPELPISSRRDEIAAAIEANQVVIVAGETGSGKTTQLPKMLLELGRGRAGQIGHTQPRRIAARTVAERIAAELGTALGDVIGYQVRFTDTSSDSTLVKVMTDGILLAQIQRDPMLWAYDTLIIDEAHERSLNIDFILGYLTTLLPKRPDLRVVITSATIDSELFSKHFDAPVINVTGRTYPVDILYRPLEASGAVGDQAAGICAAARELIALGPGDILVFCSGEREIRDAAEALADDLGAVEVRGKAGKAGKAGKGPKPGQAGARHAIEILPLYARLSAAEQHRVFEPHTARRIVLATNVAETSLTVPGVGYVIDPGTARISRYSKATKVQRLPIEPISQASANQRAGRCGRVAHGVAIRLYSEADFDSRPEFTEPEILRTSLASVILQMIAVGVVKSPADVAAFPFVEPPDARNVRDGVALLTELGALELRPATLKERAGQVALTEIGRQLAQIPIDPRLGRMIIESGKHDRVREVTILAAALAIQDPRERPLEVKELADSAHQRFADPGSDFLAYLNLWQYLRRARKELSSSAFRRLAREDYLNYLRLREWQDLVSQLRRIVRPLGLEPRSAHPAAVTSTRFAWDGEAIHRSLLAGLLSQIGMRVDTEVGAASAADGRPRRRVGRKRSRNDYQGARGARFAIFPGSPLSNQPPGWVMAAELVETSRLWGRDVAAIQPEWVEPLAGDLVKHTYSNPHWSAKQGRAVIDERVWLYGLPIIAARPVGLAARDPEQARELFIRRALVDGEWRTQHEFHLRNQAMLAEAEELAERTRGRVPGVDAEDLFDFYDARIPGNVCSTSDFDAWWKKAGRERPGWLDATPEELGRVVAGTDSEGFPDQLEIGQFSLPVTYTFNPGAPDDGATLHIPVAIANQIPPDGLDWQVPGLRAELVAALIKALPKKDRSALLPATATAREVAPRLADPGDWRDRHGRILPLTDALTKVFGEVKDVYVAPEAWNYDRVPAHLRMRFVISNPRGEPMAEGTNFLAVRDAATPGIREALAQLAAARGGKAEAGTKAGTKAGTRAGKGAGQRAARPPGVAPVAALRTRSGLTTWDFGDLPEELAVRLPGGETVRGYPALVDEGRAGVGLRVLEDTAHQAAAMPRGVRELLLRELELPPGRITSRLRPEVALPLAASRYANSDALVADIQRAAVAGLMAASGRGLPQTQAAYQALREWIRQRLEDRVGELTTRVSRLISEARAVEERASELTSVDVANSVAEIKGHLSSLLGAGFVSRAGEARLVSFHRYIAADAYRLERLGSTRAREEQGIWTLSRVREAYEEALSKLPPGSVPPPALDEVPWMVEELRVSLFAQHLGTAHPVSEKRISKAIASALGR